MSAIDHRQAPENKYEGEYPDEDAAYHAHDLASESVE